jgi:MFS family permease
LHFGGAIISALAGGVLAQRIAKKSIFYVFWILLGVFSSFMLWTPNSFFTGYTIILPFLFMLIGISFGLGMPFCMAYYTTSTEVDNRAKFGGLILFIAILGGVIIFLILKIYDYRFAHSLILSIFRFSGLIVLLFDKPIKNGLRNRYVSYFSIINQRSLLLYLIPWFMFSLVNYLGISIQIKILEEAMVNQLISIENVLVGIFAVIGGFLSDMLGRKRMAIIGFVALGISHAILGMFPYSSISWYLYTAIDGIAWGILSVIFIITIWGDLAFSSPSEKYYALGLLPHFLSNYLRIILGSNIADFISVYAIFSFTALFLFLAVIPLMFAPETLPEKKIRERELKQYVEKAKKIREKYG